MRASGRSTLLTTRTTGRRPSSALRRTKRVCGSGPSDASTSSRTPSTIVRPRSTSPPKSAWPGVSTMFSLMSPWRTAVFLARIVMPFSRSRSIESMTRSATSWFARNAPDCHSIASTSVVLPWSTWATIATLRRSLREVTTHEPTWACPQIRVALYPCLRMNYRLRHMDCDLLTTFAAEVRDNVTPDDEGTVWALFMDGAGRPLLATSVSEHREEPHALAYLLANVGADAVAIAVVRRDSTPLDADRKLFGALHTLLAGERTRLVGGITVGPYGWQWIYDEKGISPL